MGPEFESPAGHQINKNHTHHGVVFIYLKVSRRFEQSNATVRWTVACRRLTRRQHHKFFRRKNCNESPRVTKPHPPRCGSYFLILWMPEIRTIKCNRTRFAKEYFSHLRKYLFFLLYPNEDVREQNQRCGSCRVAEYVLSNNIDTMQRVNDTMEQDT